MKLASMMGSKASPLERNVPSFNCSARSRIILSSRFPRGMRLSKFTSSDSWLANFTSSGLVLAGGRAISRPNMPTQNARWKCSRFSANTVQRNAHLARVAEAKQLSWCEAGFTCFFLLPLAGSGGSSTIRSGGLASSSLANLTPSVQASLP